MEGRITKQGLSMAGSNALLALVYLFFVFAHLSNFAETFRLSVLLMALFETIVVVMILIRRDTNEVWHSWQTWVTSMGGSFLPLFFRPTAVADDVLLAQIIQIGAVCLQTAAILSLNRSFGLLPARRGVKTGGLYRAVRHPLYAAYAFAQIGYLINNFDLYNVAIFLTASTLQVMRISNEEAFLLQDEGYVSYAKKTRWRLIPLVW